MKPRTHFANRLTGKDLDRLDVPLARRVDGGWLRQIVDAYTVALCSRDAWD